MTLAIELRHLRYVLAAAERGSFRSAAKALLVQESSISRRIRDLEDDLGVALFIRHHGGVQLTHAGQRFLKQAQRALNQIESATVDAGLFGRGESGAVRIGIFTSLASGFLSELLREYVTQNAKVRLDIIEGSPSAHISAIRRLQLDVAFLTGRPHAENCEVSHLWNERVLVAMPKDHWLSSKRSVEWSDILNARFIVSELDPGPEILDYIVKHVADLGRRPDVNCIGVGRDNLMTLVAMGQGLTLTSEATCAARFPGVVYRPIKGEILPFCAVWSPANDNPALRRLLSLARSMAKAAAPCVALLVGFPIHEAYA